MKPLIKYRGGKFEDFKFFKKYIPHQMNVYYEPFLGGGAVFFKIDPLRAYVADINKPLITFYKDLVLHYSEVKSELHRIQGVYEYNVQQYKNYKKENKNKYVKDMNSQLYYNIRDMYNNKKSREYHYATLYYFLNKTAYSGMIRYNKHGDFNVPYGRYKNFNTNLITHDQVTLLKRSTIKCESYEHSFTKATPSDFMFLDPPYDTTFSSYGNKKDFNKNSQIKLAKDFKNLNTRALMIIAKTPLTWHLYHNYVCDTYSKDYSVNIRNRFHSKATHLIITNY